MLLIQILQLQLHCKFHAKYWTFLHEITQSLKEIFVNKRDVIRTSVIKSDVMRICCLRHETIIIR
jgi:hypothetical protein